MDPGSAISLISDKFVKINKLSSSKCVPLVLKGFFGDSIVDRKINVSLLLNSKRVNFDVFVVKSSLLIDCQLLLGLDVLGKKIGITIPIENKPYLTFSTESQKGISKNAVSNTSMRVNENHSRMKPSNLKRLSNHAVSNTSSLKVNENHDSVIKLRNSRKSDRMWRKAAKVQVVVPQKNLTRRQKTALDRKQRKLRRKLFNKNLVNVPTYDISEIVKSKSDIQDYPYDNKVQMLGLLQRLMYLLKNQNL